MVRQILKRVYSRIPFKKQLFSLLKLFWIPSHSIYQHLHFRGVFEVKVENKTFKIRHYGYEVENDLFWKGIGHGWEGTSLKLWMELCKVSTTIIDIGANTGVYALVAKTANYNADVYAFEPIKQVFDKLRGNCVINHYPIECLEYAVSNNDGTAKVFLPATEHVYSVTVNQNRLGGSIRVYEQEVKTKRLSSFIEERKIMNIDLMKIDVETHEVEVLEGMGRYLEEMRPSIILEVLTDEVGRRLEKALEGKGYSFFYIDEEGPITGVQQLRPKDSLNYLVCTLLTAKRLRLPD